MRRCTSYKWPSQHAADLTCALTVRRTDSKECPSRLIVGRASLGLKKSQKEDARLLPRRTLLALSGLASMAPHPGLSATGASVRVGVLRFGTLAWELDTITRHGLLALAGLASVAPHPGLAESTASVRVGVLRFGTLAWELDTIAKHGLAAAEGVSISRSLSPRTMPAAWRCWQDRPTSSSATGSGSHASALRISRFSSRPSPAASAR
jgi:hypothetical protein